MMPDDLDQWAEDFAAFHARFADLFPRKEPRGQAAKYLRGLMAPVQRKNTWQIAEAVGDQIPDATQRLLYRVQWDADVARDRLDEFVIDTFADPEGIGVLDDTGFVKKGSGSVGVKRQYCGTVGKIENCQVAVFLTYTTARGHVFLDRRLYLPEDWCTDPNRRQRAKVPADITFQTKDELACAMLDQAWAHGIPLRWVVGDEVYGDATAVRDTIAAHHCWYVMAVRSTTVVWLERPEVVARQQKRYGPPATEPVLAADAPPLLSASTVVASWPESSWQRLTVAEGEKGPRTYDWACCRVVEPRARMPGPDGWLLARRSISEPKEIAYYLSNAPVDTPLLTLAQVASARYTVEQCIEEAKGETGLDEYQTRHWQSWHRHITLSMMAHAWLASIRWKASKKGGLSPSWPS